jgi:hypothetical protein
VEKTKEKYDSPDIKKLFHDPINEKLEPKLGNVLLKNTDKQFVCTMNPFKLNERLTIQKGVFMWSGDVTKTFEDNLKAIDGYRQKVKRILIPNKLRMETLCKLYEMNVTQATLFPGLDGFARSLSILPPILFMEGSLLNLADNSSKNTV